MGLSNFLCINRKHKTNSFWKLFLAVKLTTFTTPGISLSDKIYLNHITMFYPAKHLFLSIPIIPQLILQYPGVIHSNASRIYPPKTSTSVLSSLPKLSPVHSPDYLLFATQIISYLYSFLRSPDYLLSLLLPLLPRLSPISTPPSTP